MLKKIIIPLVVIIGISALTTRNHTSDQPVESSASRETPQTHPSKKETSVTPKQTAKTELVVGASSDAQFSSIQTALNAAKPGNTILVRGGVYKEKLEWNTSGIKDAPIILKNYPGEHPIIEPPGTAYKDYVALNGEWQVLDGFEIRNGWDGVVVNGSHNTVKNNYIHNNGDSCSVQEYCGQGILVASASDITIENNRIESNGLTNYSPWHVHGIYLSDYYKKGMHDIVIKGNTLGGHGGAGVHVYNATARVTNVYIEDNLFENNALEILLTNVDNASITGNTIIHNRYPKTDAPRTALLWLELNTDITFEQNAFTYGIAETNKLPSYVIYFGSQDKKELNFSQNTWEIAGHPEITDADVTK